MKIEESNLKKWTGIYKGVNFEINNWKIKPNVIEQYEKDCWTYYLILKLERIPEEHKPKSYWLRGRKYRNHVLYDYCKHPVLLNLEWHGGITWYSKEHGFDGAEKIIKVGCDYMHLWDEKRYYNLDYVKEDVKQTIESFLKQVPNYKYLCYGNGNLYDLSDGIVQDGSFYSKEYWGDKDWFNKDWFKSIVEKLSKEKNDDTGDKD